MLRKLSTQRIQHNSTSAQPTSADIRQHGQNPTSEIAGSRKRSLQHVPVTQACQHVIKWMVEEVEKFSN